MLSRSCIIPLCVATSCLVGSVDAARAIVSDVDDMQDGAFKQKAVYGLAAAVAVATVVGLAGSSKKEEETENAKTLQEEVPLPETQGPAKNYEYTVAEQKVVSSFPFAMTNSELVRTVEAALKPYGYGKNSLLATSLCCDEVNRVLDDDLAEVFGDNFSMGGLAGFAFGGVTSFGAMAHHIPEGGSCLIVYGPHVGVDADGNVGKINRRGRVKSGPCCGSAAAACGFAMTEGATCPIASADPIDAQQAYVSAQLLPYADRLKSSSNVQVELPKALFDAQKKLMDRIVAAGCGEVHSPGKIAVLGGIQINTPAGVSDYFLPLSFELRDNKAKLERKFV